VLSLFREINKPNETKYLDRLKQLEGLRPIHVGIDPYLTLDVDSNIEEIF